MLTWGDGLSTVDLDALLAFHRSHGKLATLTAARPPARFGHLDIGESGLITEFSEKPQTGEGWINGAFFVLEPAIFDYIAGDETQFEKEPLENLAKDGQLMAYQHFGLEIASCLRRSGRLARHPGKFGAIDYAHTRKRTRRIHRHGPGSNAAAAWP
jgi:glucose-1-phosphate cytidylyltransferase